jgi:hypothetical protein
MGCRHAAVLVLVGCYRAPGPPGMTTSRIIERDGRVVARRAALARKLALRPVFWIQR